MEVICLKFDDVYYQVDSRVKVTLAMQHTRNRFTELFWLRSHIKKEKPDVIIPFTEGVYCFTILALLGTRFPIIASERLDPSAMSASRKILKRLLLPLADWLVVQTQSIKEYFPKSIQKKTSVIYNPVNEEVFGVNDNGRWTMDNQQNRIISVGRLYPQKNQQLMIRAFAQIADKFPDWQLVIYGEGPLRDSLELIVDSLQLRGRVLLPGRTENVVEELRKSKIFCMSSDYEGMSNSMIEAICMGLPIITTKVSGTEELIKDGENGLLVEIGNEKELADAFATLMSNAKMAKSLSEHNTLLASRFKIDEIVSRWISLTNKITNQL